MELWVAFGFGAAVGALIGYLLGRQTQVPAPGRARPAPPSLPPPSFRSASPASPEIKHVVINGVLAERESTFRELGVKVVRAVPGDLPMVACPMAQLTEMLTKLLDFSLRRLRASQPPRELRLEVIATGPSVVASLWDSGTPLAVEAEQRLTSPFRFTQSGGGGEVEFALARALAQSAGGNLRLRPRGGSSGAEVVVTLPRSLLGAHTPLSTPAESLPRMRILVVDDD